MQLKNSFIWFTALTAGTSVARLHGHERRHAHHHDKRGVGQMVYATIDGIVQSWVNEFNGGGGGGGGHQATSTTESTTQATEAPTTTTPADVPAEPTATSAANWYDVPEDGNYSREGFGRQTQDNNAKYINYKGNVGDPWGSNIIQVDGNKASQYRHVIEFKGSNVDPWTVVFWNKMGPDGQLTGWYGNSALKFTLEPGETRYVAVDDDSQGAWGAAKGENLPTDEFGGYSCTWGEFDFSSTKNNGWSGWDVSAIQAQAASQEVQGMKICTHDNQNCSSVSRNAANVINAYIKSLASANGIGGNSNAHAIRLSAHVDFNE